MEIFTIDAVKISGECYAIIDANHIIVPPTLVDPTSTTITAITEGIIIKTGNSIEELNNELVTLGYTLPEDNLNNEII